MTEADIVRFPGEGNPGAGLVFNGVRVHDRNEMLSLTDMWKAAGGDLSKQPAKWRDLPSTKEFVSHVAGVILRKSEDGVFQVVRGGNNPVTWAHWQVGLAYAKYLSPEFHMQCNEVIRAHMEKAQAPALSDAHVTRLLRDFSHWRAAQTRELAEMKEQLNAVVEVVTPSAPGVFVNGVSPGEILKEAGFEKSPAGFPYWFGNRLADAGVPVVGRDRSNTRLFQRDAAHEWLRNGGRATVSRYLAERKGQGSLPGIGRRMKKASTKGYGVIGMGDEIVTYRAGMPVCPGEEALLVMSQDGVHFAIATRTMTGFDVTKLVRFGPPQGSMGMLPINICVGRVIERKPVH